MVCLKQETPCQHTDRDLVLVMFRLVVMTDNRLDPVVRKPINTNPQLQVTRVFISLIKNDFKSSF